MLWSPNLLYPSKNPEPSTSQQTSVKQKTSQSVISGVPIRIEIPDSNISLDVINGGYDQTTKAWTLSEDKAMFASVSPQPNNKSGQTFIYGHGTDRVFGKIGNKHPELGSTAKLYTENGRVFSYRLSEIKDLKPSDTWIFKEQLTGQPRLVIQTCTGIFSEFRTMFMYQLENVDWAYI